MGHIAQRTPDPRWEKTLRRADQAFNAVKLLGEEMVRKMQTAPEVTVGQKFYRDRDFVHLVMMIHRENEYAIWASVDGNSKAAVRLPLVVGKTRLSIRRHHALAQFCVVGMSGFLANGREGDYARPPIVQAQSPQLFDQIQWSAQQREAWRHCRIWRDRFIDDAANFGKKKTSGTYSLGNWGASSW